MCCRSFLFVAAAATAAALLGADTNAAVLGPFKGWEGGVGGGAGRRGRGGVVRRLQLKLFYCSGSLTSAALHDLALFSSYHTVNSTDKSSLVGYQRVVGTALSVLVAMHSLLALW